MPDRIEDMAAEFEAHAAETSRFDPLSEVTRILSAIPDRTLFLEALLATAKRCFLADHAAILSYHRPTDRWFLEASHGLTDDTIEEIKGLSWTVIQASSSKAQSLLIADTADHELTRDTPSIRAYNILSVLCTPILGATGIWGLIYIDSSSVPNAFDKRAEKELEKFAEFAGIAIQQCEDIVRLTPRPSAQASEEADRPFLDFASSKMREVMAVLERAAATDVPVLLVGETGTGKDVLARWVHQKSARHDAPFVQVNCTNIPQNLVESELFGIEGRVASGVDFQEGRIKLADGGTVFLTRLVNSPCLSKRRSSGPSRTKCSTASAARLRWASMCVSSVRPTAISVPCSRPVASGEICTTASMFLRPRYLPCGIGRKTFRSWPHISST